MQHVRILAFHSSQSHSGQWRALQQDIHHHWPDSPLEGLDLIGYGQGPVLDKLAADFRFDDEIAALQATGTFADDTPLVLIGHSYGGALAMRLARELGDRVVGVIVYEPVAFHVLPAAHPARSEIVAIAKTMDTSSLSQACAAFVDYWNQPGYFAALPPRLQRAMITHQRKVSADFHALFDEPARAEDYAEIACPVWLLHGNQSPLSSRTVADILAAHVPVCHRITVDAGHMGPLTHPERVNPHLVQALHTLLAGLD